MADDWLNWVAIYDDGEEFHQVDGEKENSYHAIDRTKLKEFNLYNPENHEVRFMMAIEPEKRLVFRRRVAMDGNTGLVKWVIYLVGWQQTVKGKNIQSLNWLFEDGSVLNTGKFNESSAILYGITEAEEEK